MKEFVIEEFERFIEIADTVATPFKFYEIQESDVGENYRFLSAKVWLRTAYLTYEADIQKDELKEPVETLKRHGFTSAKIRESTTIFK